ncbi:MAG: beta-ketoacyl synthase N-terminal-like domain-containing protein [Myxococcota bacterium]|nr:beta-ketoacyl synthase N-terminal-like domain-containing protein [Myxococcota bacterium]
MAERLCISGAGVVTWAGPGVEAVSEALEGRHPFVQEELGEGLSLRVGRIGRLKDPESAAAYERWGQLDTYSRYGFAAARGALADAGVVEESPGRPEMGILLGTQFGCMEENQRFDRFSIDDGLVKASPLAFKGTVDNAPAGWIAVAWKLRGPNATFVSGDGAALEALWTAEGQLLDGRAPALLVGGVERIVDMHLLLRDRDPERQAEILSEGAGVLLVEREDSLRRRGRSPEQAQAELVGVARCRGSLAEAKAQALAQLGIGVQSVGLESLATPGGDKAQLGEFHGAWGAVALCAALVRRNRSGAGWDGRPHALVHAFGERNEHFFAVLRDPSSEEAG